MDLVFSLLFNFIVFQLQNKLKTRGLGIPSARVHVCLSSGITSGHKARSDAREPGPRTVGQGKGAAPRLPRQPVLPTEEEQGGGAHRQGEERRHTRKPLSIARHDILLLLQLTGERQQPRLLVVKASP